MGARALPMLLLFPLMWGAMGCPGNEEGASQNLKAPTQDAAIDLVTRFFNAYVNLNTETVLQLMCEQDSMNQRRAATFVEQSQSLRSPYRVNRFHIRSVVPLWMKKDPYFRVEVSFPRNRGPGELLHAYSVRVRDGCLEGFLAPPGASANQNAPGPVIDDDTEPFSVPAPAPEVAPGTENLDAEQAAEVIEL